MDRTWSVIYRSFDDMENFILMEGTERKNSSALVPGQVRTLTYSVNEAVVQFIKETWKTLSSLKFSSFHLAEFGGKALLIYVMYLGNYNIILVINMLYHTTDCNKTINFNRWISHWQSTTQRTSGWILGYIPKSVRLARPVVQQVAPSVCGCEWLHVNIMMASSHPELTNLYRDCIYLLLWWSHYVRLLVTDSCHISLTKRLYCDIETD